MDDELRRLERQAKNDPILEKRFKRLLQRAHITKRGQMAQEINALESEANNLFPHIKLRLTFRKDWAGDYKITWRENGKIDYDKTYYTDDLEDAIGTLRFTVERLRKEKYETRKNPDDEIRSLVRKWEADPGDQDVINKLDRAAERAAGLTVYAASGIRAMCFEILERRRHGYRGTQAHIISLAERFSRIDPGQNLSQEDHQDLVGIAGEIFGYLAEPPAGWRTDRRPHHFYREKMILVGLDAETYAERYGVPLHTQNSPSQVELNVIGRPQFSHSPWCYRLFAIGTAYFAEQYGGCPGNTLPPRRRGPRGCGQSLFGCICGTMCSSCGHCTGCSFSRRRTDNHPSECICDGFGYAAFGERIAIDTHQTGYLCGCHGSGWASTDFDTVHECPIHPIAGHHPECDAESGADYRYCCGREQRPAPPSMPSTPIDEDDLPF